MRRAGWARRQGLPAVSMAVGLGVTAVAGLAFLAAVGRALPAREAAAVTSLYLLINTIGPGVFIALEMETSRALSRGLAEARPVRLLRKKAWRIGLTLLIANGALVLLASTLLVPTAFQGDWRLLLCLLLSLAAAMAAYVVRGLLGGEGRFSAYGLTLSVEGCARAAPALALAAFGSSRAALYGLVYACGQIFSAAAGAILMRRRGHKGGHGPPAEGPLVRGVLLLVVSSGLTQLLQNMVPVVVTSRLSERPDLALAFAQAFIIVRAPLLLFAPVQAMLLPSLTAAMARGEATLVRRRLNAVVLAVFLVGGASGVFFVTVGPQLLSVFGAPVKLSTAALALLSAGALLMMLVNSLQPALVALQRQGTFTLGWLIGAAAMAGTVALPVAPVNAGLAAALVGPAIVLAFVIAGVRPAFRVGQQQGTDQVGAVRGSTSLRGRV